MNAPMHHDLEAAAQVCAHVAKGALSMIDIANNKPQNRGKKPKVGGHQASSMSSLHLLMVLYLLEKRAEDLVAVKPHAAPVLYSLMHLMGVLPREQMLELREFGGPQPYPTRLKNPLFVDYTTSSEALGVCAAIYDAYAAVLQNRQLVETTGAAPVTGTFWAHCGDGELTEGQIDESLYDAGRWGLDNLVWIVDLNRQSLDRVMDDSGQLSEWASAKFRHHGWHVIELRWGAKARALFARPGGAALRSVLERLPDSLFHPLLLLPLGVVRLALTGGRDHADPAMATLLGMFGEAAITAEEARDVGLALHDVSDDALREALHHLGGHDLGVLRAACREARAHRGQPVVIIAHTVKGWGTSAAAHPENHGMLLPTSEVASWGLADGLTADDPFPTPADDSPASALVARRAAELFVAEDHRWVEAPLDDIRQVLAGVRLARRDSTSTGEAFQSLNLALLRTEVAPFMQFGAPDVGQTTHLGPVIKRTGVFAPRDLPDTWAWMREARQLAFDWRPSPMGQFHSMGIAEGNAALWAYAFGRRVKAVEGRVPLLPVLTVYDKFFERGFNQLDYAVYSSGRFVAVGVPSGTGLCRETATHQSLQTPRMMMDLPGILTYEPAFAADVHAVYRHALGQLWDPQGEAVYLRLSTQPLDQPTVLPDDHEQQAIRGGYWLVGEDRREPSAGESTVVFVASGRMLAAARQAAARLHQRGIGSRILNVTSYEALWRDWDAFQQDAAAWDDPTRSYRLHDLFDDRLVNAPMLMVGDHFPSVCEWLPNALQRLRGARFLGPRSNGQAGDLDSVDRLHGMSVDDLVRVADEELAWRARDLR